MNEQLVALRRVGDRIDREFDQPLSVEALAAGEQRLPTIVVKNAL
ncbi:hypothetical protein [Brevibacterium linens]